MKAILVNGKRAVIAHDESAEVAEPRQGVLHDSASLAAAQRPTVLRRRFTPILPMWSDRLDAALSQLGAQGVAIVAPVGDEANLLLPRTSGTIPTPYTDRRHAGTRFPEQVSVDSMIHPARATCPGLGSRVASEPWRADPLPMGFWRRTA